jgi:prepilin-type N-terminal cleavage/methylation domain-containing protein
MNTAKNSSGFTLVELLVVITIIVILLALLTPALDKAMEATAIAVCATNQHAMHGGVLSYSLDHRRRLLQTVILGGPFRLAALARKKDGAAPNGLYDEWNVVKVGPYTGGVFPDDPDRVARLRDIWFCPSQIPPEDEPMRTLITRHWDSSANPVGVGPAVSWEHLFLPYAYFARLDNVGDRVTRPQDLTRDKLGSTRVLLSDTIYWGPDAVWGWFYNHGLDGPSYFVTEANHIRRMTGANQALADGSVHWKTADRFQFDVMVNHLYDPSQTETGMMDGSGGIVSYW